MPKQPGKQRQRKLRLLWSGLGLLAMGLVAACADTSSTQATPAPETTEAAPPTTEAAADTAAAAPPTTETVADTAPSTTEAAADTAPPTAAGTALALMKDRSETVESLMAGIFAAFDAGGLDALAQRFAGGSDRNSSAPFFMAVDSGGDIVLHPSADFVGRSVTSELGYDMYGYPWHQQLLSSPQGGYIVMMNRAGSHNPIVDSASPDAPEMSVFDDWRTDQLLFRTIAFRPHGGYVFVAVSQELAAAEANSTMLRFGAELLAGGADVATAGDAVTIGNDVFAALAHAGRWHSENSGGAGRFVGFLADAEGIILDSRFDPSVVGLPAADLIGAGILSQATESGTRYRDDSGIDLTMLSIPNGYVVAGGVSGR